MIEKKYLERCSALLGNEKAISYLCLMLTNDDMTGVDFTATIEEMALMLSNAALRRPEILIALDLSYKLLGEHFQHSTACGNN